MSDRTGVGSDVCSFGTALGRGQGGWILNIMWCTSLYHINISNKYVQSTGWMAETGGENGGRPV